jgi:hypothetical protein
MQYLMDLPNSSIVSFVDVVQDLKDGRRSNGVTSRPRLGWREKKPRPWLGDLLTPGQRERAKKDGTEIMRDSDVLTASHEYSSMPIRNQKGMMRR